MPPIARVSAAIGARSRRWRGVRRTGSGGGCLSDPLDPLSTRSTSDDLARTGDIIGAAGHYKRSRVSVQEISREISDGALHKLHISHGAHNRLCNPSNCRRSVFTNCRRMEDREQLQQGSRNREDELSARTKASWLRRL